MATYLKRTSKFFDLSLSRTASGEVNLRDLMCPVCRGILIEPVTLPCTHNLCLRCLKGSFEHNSLTCPLCRVRVGSWLRTATKSETLVNNALWELIRAKFPKEIEDKHNDRDDRDIELDAGFTANKILSAAGEIRSEYEAQLQMAQKEIQRQREAEQIASQALICKIQAEEQQQQLAQLAQDQIYARTLAKSQVLEKQKEVPKFYGEYSNAAGAPNCTFDMSKYNIVNPNTAALSKLENQNLDCGKTNLLELRDGSELRRSNIALISKIRAERYASSMKVNATNVCKDSCVRFCCQKSIPVYNAISRTLKHQAVMTVTQASSANYSAEASTSTSKIYGTQSKEELHVPNDVVNSKKKSLGVEVCMTVADDDERIGSAESAGSHDSINQEIHHFKPIKAMPRTPLKLSSDGRQIDPKLIRVVPVLKRVSNAVPKAPSQAHLKRIIGCSWSAFRGKTRQYSREKEAAASSEDTAETERQPSTSYNMAQIMSNKSVKPHTHDIIRRLDFIPEVINNTSKTCAKSVNRVFNGTKVSKRLSLEEHMETGKVEKSWKTHVRNGMVGKCKRRRNIWTGKKDVKPPIDEKDMNDVDMRDSTSSSASAKTSPNYEDSRETETTIENIAERIKKRKVNADKKDAKVSLNLEMEVETDRKRSARKRLGRKAEVDLVDEEESTVTIEKRIKKKLTGSTFSKTRRSRRTRRTKPVSPVKSDSSLDTNYKALVSGFRKSTRKTKHTSSCSMSSEQDITSEKATGSKYNYNSSDSCSETQEFVPENNNTGESVMQVEKNDLSDDDVVKEQERMERLVLQEKEDFELAQRLQAKFDEMGRIAGRTRRSRKAIEAESIEVDLYKIEITRTAGKSTVKQSSTVHQTVNSEPRKRGRPPKRVK